MARIKLAVSVIILIAMVILCRQIITVSIQNQANKQDYAEINHIRYGIFSVNAWKDKLTTIVTDEISNLNFSATAGKELKKHIAMQLEALITQVDKKIREKNKGSAKGYMKQALINTFVDIDDIKKDIPDYTETIYRQLTKAKTEKKIKGMLKDKVENYLDKTFETQDLSKLNAIIQRTGAVDIEAAKFQLGQTIEMNRKQIYLNTGILLSLALILFLMTGLKRDPIRPKQFIVLVLSLVVLLAAGVTIPMIDMEAKISELSFILMDHPLSFANQVLYFQTKSILDVFWIMIIHSDIEMKIVGILMVTFSIIFPLFKLFSSLGYFYNWRNARNSKWIQFFVFKAGKWSMTDVMIVAIFMAYIGFNGIISSQFGNFNSPSQDMVILTTNGTSLQPGFYIFFVYTVLALFLSGFLTREPKIK